MHTEGVSYRNIVAELGHEYRAATGKGMAWGVARQIVLGRGHYATAEAHAAVLEEVVA
ncbi:MAG: hypothetical protein H7Z41_09400 [Cytophagales bacterium]|nr:hypothetical protein [Armatimonadota bacterium]